MNVLLANPRGFCAGVDRAIAIVEQALAQYGAPIYVRHEVVHNKFVVDALRAKGAVFVDELGDIPVGSTVVFSAHGVSRAVRAEARSRNLTVFDATCPLVTKVHIEVAKMREHGRELVMIGHAGHPEVEGTMGQSDGGTRRVCRRRPRGSPVVRDPGNSRTSPDHAFGRRCRSRGRRLKSLPTIIGRRRTTFAATQNRQDAVKIMAPRCDIVIVVGSSNSSNSNRLREVAANRGIDAYMIDNALELQQEWLTGKGRVGVTAGASAPEVLVREVIARLKELGAIDVQELDGVVERIVFPLPKGLSTKAAAGAG